MMEHNWVLTTLVVTYIFSIAFYNYFGLKVAHDMTSVHRTFIDTCRTIIVSDFLQFNNYTMANG
jgi:hypothetical protein